MLCDGELLGVFQVESRAQMNMLPRLKPRTFYDLVIEVAIVRPGPIQGDMVHPYLRRRNNLEKVTYPSPSPEHGPADELYKVLHKTKGVPLFQEQAMRIAIEAAKFTPEEANGLRRSMATFRNVGTIGQYEEKLIGNMVARGYDANFARSCFDQIKGFGSYGFPESHAASFAQLVYISSWLKYHHPDAFCCGLLNSQPMGFYAPAQIVGDARKNGVEVREIDVSYSFAQNTLENTGEVYCAVRLGFRQIDGFHWLDPDEEFLKKEQAKRRGEEYVSPKDWADRIVAARNLGPFTSLRRLRPRHRLPKRALILLADADAFRSLGLDRREALWQVRRLPDDVAAAAVRGGHRTRAAGRAGQAVAGDAASPNRSSRTTRPFALSLKGHPMEFLREMFTRERIVACKEINHENERRRVRCAGVVLVRQRPGSASGVVFMTLEDETGIANVVVWPKIMEQYRKEVMGARLILVEGYIQSSPEKVTHLIAQRMIDRSHDLVGLANDALGRKHPVPAGAAVIEPLNDDPPRPRGYARAKTPPPPQRPHPAAVAGFSLRSVGHAALAAIIARSRSAEQSRLSSGRDGDCFGYARNDRVRSRNSPGSRSRRPRRDWSPW